MHIIEFLSDKAFSVPLWEIALLVLINLACLISGKYRSGLTISCFFMLYWGFVLNMGYFVETFGLYLYVVSGAIAAIGIMTSFFVDSNR